MEFASLEQIKQRFGEKGITKYIIDFRTGKAFISDDTQMTLFTANGILYAETRGKLRGIGGVSYRYIERSYQDWLTT